MSWIASKRIVTDIEAQISGVPLEYAILEGTCHAGLVRFVPGAIRWSDYDQGVLFGASDEVRFRRRGDSVFHLVLISDGEVPSGDGWELAQPLRPGRRNNSHIVLWGEPDLKARGWYEGRIPAKLPYPFPASKEKDRVLISVRHYRLANHSLELSRYAGIELWGG